MAPKGRLPCVLCKRDQFDSNSVSMLQGLKSIINEKFGDGIMSAIDVFVTVEKVRERCRKYERSTANPSALHAFQTLAVVFIGAKRICTLLDDNECSWPSTVELRHALPYATRDNLCLIKLYCLLLYPPKMSWEKTS